jgi:hypothetical protein
MHLPTITISTTTSTLILEASSKIRALDMACERCHNEVAKYLMAKEVQAHGKIGKGERAFYYAFFIGMVNTVSQLAFSPDLVNKKLQLWVDELAQPGVDKSNNGTPHCSMRFGCRNSSCSLITRPTLRLWITLKKGAAGVNE